jgi:hypothetical protein
VQSEAVRCQENQKLHFMVGRRRLSPEATYRCTHRESTGGVVNAIPGFNVSAQVEELIDRQDAGNRESAARRLGITPDRLAGLLSGDWQKFSLEALAAVVRGYSVSLESLLAPLTVAAGAPTPLLEEE